VSAKYVQANPAILRWAREEAHLSLDDAASRAKISELKPRGKKDRVLPSERLARWEAGEELPTYSQLEGLATAYRRPLITFFLPVPPRKETVMADFRTVGDREFQGASPEFAALMRQVEVLQKELRQLLEEVSNRRLPFVGSCAEADGVQSVAKSIRTVLDFSLPEQKRLQNSDRLFSAIREHAELAGVFVVKKGNLGSHHSNVDVDEFRGMAICDDVAPLVCINTNDAPAAQVFTLVHELAHIWTGKTGVSNYDSATRGPQEAPVSEVFCNCVAAEFLVPEREFLQEWREEPVDDVLGWASRKSKLFKVSRFVIIRRLNDLNLITDDHFWALYRVLQTDWRNKRQRMRERGGGPAYGVQVSARLGKKLLSTVIGAAYDGKLSYKDASRMLNVKIDHFGKLYPA
jgi:Zn-dependent peptidase ImmA (M78 family)